MVGKRVLAAELLPAAAQHSVAASTISWHSAGLATPASSITKAPRSMFSARSRDLDWEPELLPSSQNSVQLKGTSESDFICAGNAEAWGSTLDRLTAICRYRAAAQLTCIGNGPLMLFAITP
eukprot:2694638-Rhodomonas_salina.1